MHTLLRRFTCRKFRNFINFPHSFDNFYRIINDLQIMKYRISKATGNSLKSCQIEPLRKLTLIRVPFTEQIFLLLSNQRKSINKQLFETLLCFIIKALRHCLKILIHLFSEMLDCLNLRFIFSAHEKKTKNQLLSI